MDILFKSDQRRIIPRWRSLKAASLTGELTFRQKTTSPIEFNTFQYLGEQKLAWDRNKNLTHAGDLLGSAYVLGLESSFSEVAKFIIENEKDELSPIIRVAKKVLKIEEPVEGSRPVDFVNGHNPFSNYYSDIRKLKTYLKKEVNNPIAWVELGRLYSLIGEFKKSKKSIDAALHLDKDNRFIVRSASRFYYHYGDREVALQIIKNSSFIKYDPWLLSAEIAYSSILERYSRMTKIGKEILDAQKFDFFSTTELASAVGTVDFSNGKLKNAKKYFNQSLIMPNDNSLAQAEWMSPNIQGIIIEPKKFDLPFAFEAKTLAAYDKNDFNLSFENAIRWKNDEPYSIRPILTASSLAGIFLNDKKESVKLLEEGLKINPNDSKLLNNLVYFLVLDDEVGKARKIFECNLLENLKDVTNINTVSITATAGLIHYREAKREEGKKYYQRSIEMAKKAKNGYLASVAMANFAREEVRFAKHAHDVEDIISQLQNMCLDRSEPEIKLLYREVMNDFKTLT